MEQNSQIEILNRMEKRQEEFFAEMRILLGALQLPPTQLPISDDEEMTRLQVIDYLGICPRTYLRRVADGTLKPRNLPGGHRYYKSDLAEARKESIRKGKI